MPAAVGHVGEAAARRRCGTAWRAPACRRAGCNSRGRRPRRGRPCSTRARSRGSGRRTDRGGRRGRSRRTRRSCSTADRPTPGRRRDVGERAVAVVVEQRGGAEAGDEQIEVAVVVVVADGGAHAVDRAARRRRASVTSVKRSVRLPSRPTVRSLRNSRLDGPTSAARGVAVQRPALDEEHVQVAVVVVVEQRHAGAHLLGHVVLAGGAVDVGEGQAGGCRRRRRTAALGSPVASAFRRVASAFRRKNQSAHAIATADFRLKAEATVEVAEAKSSSSDPRQVALDRGRERGVAELQREVSRLGRPLQPVALAARRARAPWTARTGSAALRRRAARSASAARRRPRPGAPAR